MAATIVYRHTGGSLVSFESGAQNDPDACLGKWISTTAYSDDVLDNFFRAFTLAEMISGTFYVAAGFINTDAVDLVDARVYVESFSLPAGVTISMGVDTVLGMDVRANQMKAIINNTSAPTVISFTNISSLDSYANGLKLGVSPNDQDLTNLVQAQVWIRFVLSSATSFSPPNDKFVLRVEGS